MREALKREGLTDEQITVETDTVIKTEDGFVAYRIEHDLPYITHFLIYPEKRKNSMAWLDLYSKFKDEIKAKGYDLHIASVEPGRERFLSFIKHYRGMEYTKVGDHTFYLLPVR